MGKIINHGVSHFVKYIDNLLIKGESVAHSNNNNNNNKFNNNKNGLSLSSNKRNNISSSPTSSILNADLHPWSARSNNNVKNMDDIDTSNMNNPFTFSIEKFEHPANHNLSVTVSIGDGDSYNIRVSTHDGHGFTKKYDGDVKSAASFSDLFSRAGSPLMISPRSQSASFQHSLSRGKTPTTFSRGQSRKSFRESLGSSRRVTTRGSMLSRGRASTTSSRQSRASNQLRAMRLLNKLTRSLKSKREAKRELLLSQQEFREMFDLRERISTPLPPIEKPVYNCDIPEWLMPKRHCSHPLFTTFDVKTSKNPIESNAAELSHQRLDRYLWVHESKSNDGNNNTNTNKANDSDTMFNNDIIAKEQEGEFKKHHYQLSEDVDEEEVEVDKIYYDEDGNEIEGMIDGESNVANNNNKKSIYAEEPLDILEKTPDHYYYPNFFQDKHDIQSDRRKELAELSFMKHDKILHGMDDLKELLKDVKQRKMKRKKSKKWSSARSSWLKG